MILKNTADPRFPSSWSKPQALSSAMSAELYRMLAQSPKVGAPTPIAHYRMVALRTFISWPSTIEGSDTPLAFQLKTE